MIPSVSYTHLDEWAEMYPTFAEVADREGFPAIAETFRQIATVEQHHEARYLKPVSYTHLPPES